MLNADQVEQIIKQGEAACDKIASFDGMRSNSNPDIGPVGKRPVKMHIAIVARDGSLIKLHSQEDAWEGSRDIAIAKARTAAFFSSNEQALTSRVIGALSQVTTGEDGKITTGPLWGIGHSNQIGATGDASSRNGLITFPGGVPLYVDGKLVGGVGVSGDGVDQDEAVAFAAAQGFEPGDNIVKLGMTPPDVDTV